MGEGIWTRCGAALVFIAVGCGKPAIPRKTDFSASSVTVTCAAHSLRAYDASRSVVSGPSLGCEATVSSAEGPREGLEVTVLTEAGRFDRATSITAADGTVSLIHVPTERRPRDVEPEAFAMAPTVDPTHTGVSVAPSWMQPTKWRDNPAAMLDGPPTFREPRRPDPLRLNPDGTRPTNNPRDNLVTFIVVVDGRETFTDLNGNLTHDPGEPFVDTLEPFVDENDNGTFDVGEAFVDSNGNRQWDGANGVFDANTKIWVQERVLWTGVPDVADALTVFPGVPGQRQVLASQPAVILADCTSLPDCLSLGGAPSALILISDPWWNAPTWQEGDRCEFPAGPFHFSSELTNGPLFAQANVPSPLIIRVDVSRRASDPPLPTGTVIVNATPLCHFRGWAGASELLISFPGPVVQP